MEPQYRSNKAQAEAPLAVQAGAWAQPCDAGALAHASGAQLSLLLA